MACALTTGFTLDCRDAVGGLKEVYIIELGNATFTELSGVITAVTNASTKKWYKYSLIRETSNAEETITGNEQNGTIFYAQKVDIIINKRQVSVRNEILLLAKNHVNVVAVDNIGNAWLFGRVNGVMLNAGTAPTGTAWGDRNGYTLTFSGNEVELAPQVSSGLITNLTVAGM